LSNKKGTFQKGNKAGVGHGRPPILLPELQKEINANKNAVKQLILVYLNLNEAQLAVRQSAPNMPMVEKWLGNIIEKGVLHGDAITFKALLEIPLGKLPEEKSDFDVSPEERELIIEYRRRLASQVKLESLPGGEQSDSRNYPK